MSSQRTRLIVRFTGHVQGVGFRATTLSLGRDLEVHGDVRNESDGSVRLDVEGAKPVLEELLERIRIAMRTRIDDVQISEQPPLDRSGGLHISA